MSRTLAAHHLPKAEARSLYEDTTPPPSPEELAVRELERHFWKSRYPVPPRAPDRREREEAAGGERGRELGARGWALGARDRACRAEAAAGPAGGDGGPGIRGSGLGIRLTVADRGIDMRTSAFLAVFLLLASLTFAQTPASPAAGTWEGALNTGALKLRIGVSITVQPDGRLSATMDSPDQGASGLPLDAVTFSGGVLTFALTRANGRFEGTLNDAGTEIAGTWTQGPSLPLVLRRVEQLSRPNRPQEPKPPFPYRSEEVTVVNAAASVTLAGTLTTPEGKGPFPGVVLITGSGLAEPRRGTDGAQAVPRPCRSPHPPWHRRAPL